MRVGIARVNVLSSDPGKALPCGCNVPPRQPAQQNNGRLPTRCGNAGDLFLSVAAQHRTPASCAAQRHMSVRRTVHSVRQIVAHCRARSVTFGEPWRPPRPRGIILGRDGPVFEYLFAQARWRRVRPHAGPARRPARTPSPARPS